MKMTVAFAALVAGLALSACGRNEPPKAASGAPPTATATTMVKGQTKKEEKSDVPDTHGMPGMSELFKGDDKAGEKPAEKVDAKPAEKTSDKK
jgi:hypothetical protein